MIRAHPRSRGENCCVRHAVCVASGSSPLTRGKRWGRGCRLRGRGLIPAHAGKTQCKSLIFCARSAHPRSRGENSGGPICVWCPSGSSPLTRGKRSRRRHRSRALRAHPRSRGENMMCAIVGFPVAGSSPLTRGKRMSRALRQGAQRLIPAHAGKTRLHYASRAMYRAHPRSRGENAEKGE